MIHRMLAPGLALAVALSLLVACGRDDPADTATASDAGYPEPATGDMPQAAPPTGLTLQQAWTRAVPPNAPVAAGYLMVVNATDVDDRLVAVRTDAAERVEVHEMLSADDGTMQMRELAEGLLVPGGISVDLRPGGLHLMFFAPDPERWQPGERIPATVEFEVSGEQAVEFEVFAPGQSPAAPDMQGHGAGEGHGHHHDQDDEPAEDTHG